MASPRIEYAVLPAGEGPGQDRCFTAEGLVVVLDGASTVDPVANPDATEYVDTLGPRLIEQITSASGVDLRDALAEAIRQTAKKLALVPGTAPSSTVSIVRWGDEEVDVLVLGDSPVVVQLTDGHEYTIVQHPQDHIASELRQLYRNRLVAGHGYDEEHRSILARIQRAESERRNTLAGYWIAEAVGVAARFASANTFSASEVTACFLASDGAPRSLQALEGDIDARELSSEFLHSLLLEEFQWEESLDRNGRERPRSKRHDDKTLAVVITA